MTARKERLKTGQFAAGNSGRPKGSKNKFTTLKDDWLEVHRLMGGKDGLLKYAQAHPGWFYTNETRLFPQEHQVSGKDGDSAIRIEVVHLKGEGGNGNGGGNGHSQECAK